MIYAEPLPRTDSIMHLAEVAGAFPVSRREISRQARIYGFDTDMLHFLELFPEDETFKNSIDFIARCEELELLIRDEREMPDEGPLSPQD